MDKQLSCIETRNNSWINNKKIPKWVDINNVGLDQFFTNPNVAKDCIKSFYNYILNDDESISHYKFIEPSAGMGAFYDYLPENNRIGIDIDSFKSEYIQKDFLSWEPDIKTQKYACIGNPPFGNRGWLALMFLNHAATFSDYVGFILPMGFEGRGKGNLISRVKGLHLVHSSHLPSDSFLDIDGKIRKLNTVWQIWSKKSNNKIEDNLTCNSYIDLFMIDLNPKRRCGHKRFNEADVFLQTTFYKEASIVSNFDQVLYSSGYGIVIKKDKEKVLEVLKNTNWNEYSNLATNSCRHINMYHIRKALIDKGLIDYK